ncbi:hypothetical protein GCM10027022_16830 [Alpinimonas psychrophila]
MGNPTSLAAALTAPKRLKAAKNTAFSSSEYRRLLRGESVKTQAASGDVGSKWTSVDREATKRTAAEVYLPDCKKKDISCYRQIARPATKPQSRRR